MVRDVLDPSVVFKRFSGGGPVLEIPRARLVIAQAMALGAMAFCFFLAPQFAWCYAIIAVGGVVVLALPAVAGGPRGVVGQRLLDASPGREHLPGGIRYALRLAGMLLALFALPAAVASALPSPISERSTTPWVAIGSLLGTAGAVVAAVRLAGTGRRILAGAVVVAAAFVILAATAFLPALPALSILPGFRPD